LGGRENGSSGPTLNVQWHDSALEYRKAGAPLTSSVSLFSHAITRAFETTNKLAKVSFIEPQYIE
jgi:ABC-type uncharacterized transport system auxiliary subunit